MSSTGLGAARGATRVLVVDPVLRSRFSLVQAASLPGLLVDASVSIEAAIDLLARRRYALVIADEHLDGAGGLEFLASLRRSHPEVGRALIAAAHTGLRSKRRAIETADLAFLLVKPWDPRDLRRVLRDVVGRDAEYAGWSHARPLAIREHSREPLERPAWRLDRRDDTVLRGLLAGLNSCETTGEVFELLHAELAEPCGVRRWLWIDDARAQGGRLEGDGPADPDVSEASLAEADRKRLSQARGSLRVARLGDPDVSSADSGSSTCYLGWPFRLEHARSITILVQVDRNRACLAIVMLRELQGGLRRAIQRVDAAERRAIAARALARRVSEEVRIPVGALTHAIDRLRSEAERIGLASEWMDRISSESERVARAVEGFEGDVLSPGLGRSAT